MNQFGIMSSLLSHILSFGNDDVRTNMRLMRNGIPSFDNNSFSYVELTELN